MQDAWRAYLDLALGLTETSRKKATKVAKKLVGRGGATAEQVQSMVEELRSTSLANREAVTRLVRYELERALGRVGLATTEEVSALTSRVRELEEELADARVAAATVRSPIDTAPPVVPAPLESDARVVAAERTVAKKAVAKKAVAQKAVTQTAVAQKAVTQTAVAQKTVAKKAVAKKAVAKKMPAPDREPATQPATAETPAAATAPATAEATAPAAATPAATAAPAKKAAPKKAGTKKATAKKATAKKAVTDGTTTAVEPQ